MAAYVYFSKGIGVSLSTSSLDLIVDRIGVVADNSNERRILELITQPMREGFDQLDISVLSDSDYDIAPSLFIKAKSRMLAHPDALSYVPLWDELIDCFQRRR